MAGHKFTVRKQKFLLYDQRTQGHTQRLRNISCTTGEKLCMDDMAVKLELLSEIEENTH